ncbi:MAG: response regulator [Candidatus Eremiobacteraeota bacterium]|nr:response regulator [Candidatus Eremiobacteraeota bacterium]
MEDRAVRILLVEDNPDDVYIIRRMLSGITPTNFDLMHVMRLNEAIEILLENKFDIVLLDLSLPDSQGLDTFTELNRKTQKSPIIILSGLNDQTIAMRAVHGGAQDYLVKGEINKDKLMRSIRYAIERHNLKKDLIAKNHELEDFAYIVCHELKGPLTIFVGYLHFIKNNPPKIKEYFNPIIDECSRMDKFIKNILNLSKAGNLINEKIEIDLGDLLKRVFLHVKPQDFSVDFTIAPSIGHIIGDPERIEHIFSNLINNSIQHRDPEKEKLIINVGAEQCGGNIIISFKDNGRGIEKKHINNIFDLGFTLGKESGSGFGLVIVRKIVEAHNGRIWAESKGKNQGAEFFIRLPLNIEDKFQYFKRKEAFFPIL